MGCKVAPKGAKPVSLLSPSGDYFLVCPWLLSFRPLVSCLLSDCHFAIPTTSSRVCVDDIWTQRSGDWIVNFFFCPVPRRSGAAWSQAAHES